VTARDVVVLAVWLALSIVTGLVLGRLIANADPARGTQ